MSSDVLWCPCLNTAVCPIDVLYTLARGDDKKKREEDLCAPLQLRPNTNPWDTLQHLASGEMKVQIVLSCARHIEDRGLDSNNADCKEFILILPIGSQQVPHDNNFAWTSSCVSPQQNAGVIAAHDNIPVPALISLTWVKEAAESGWSTHWDPRLCTLIASVICVAFICPAG